MKYYVFTIEQVYNDGKLGEYATKSDAQATRKAADSLFFDKCKAINDDLSENGHAYAYVWIMGTDGKIKDDQTIGERVEA